MKKLLVTLFRYAYFSLCIALLLSIQAFAYLDASAVTYVVYILAGVAIAAGATVTLYWTKIKRWYHKKRRKAAAKKRQETNEKV